MPKRPVTISIVPSRLRLLVTLALALSVCLVVGYHAPPWLAVSVVAAFWAAIRHGWRHEASWQLRWVPGIDGGWQRRSSTADAWHGTTLHCDYLGPWLIGLRVAGRRHWLWPDSASFDERRTLRRMVMWSAR